MHLYFAYGSNMDATQMKERCPGAELLGTALLEDYELAFTIYSPTRACGCADIISKNGAAVYGLLYRLSEGDLSRMDEHEGHPKHYRRSSVIIQYEGAAHEAATYEVAHKQPPLPTSSAYLDLLRNAARLHEFPAEYQTFLASFVPKEAPM